MKLVVSRSTEAKRWAPQEREGEESPFYLMIRRPEIEKRVVIKDKMVTLSRDSDDINLYAQKVNLELVIASIVGWGGAVDDKGETYEYNGKRTQTLGLLNSLPESVYDDLVEFVNQGGEVREEEPVEAKGEAEDE